MIRKSLFIPLAVLSFFLSRIGLGEFFQWLNSNLPNRYRLDSPYVGDGLWLGADAIAALLTGWFVIAVGGGFYSIWFAGIVTILAMYAIRLQNWESHPLWFNIIDLLMIMPMFFLGSKLKR